MIKKTFKVVTLGCRTNQYESQAYHDQMVAMGYSPAAEGASAEVCIVNTCTVTESADSSSRHAIRQLAKVHMFPYSDRPRTKSATMPNKVPSDIIKQSKQEVLRLAEHVGFELRDQYVSRKMQVLTESFDPARPNEISGHTANFLQVWVQGENLESNQLLDVELVSNTPSGLIGHINHAH